MVSPNNSLFPLGGLFFLFALYGNGSDQGSTEAFVVSYDDVQEVINISHDLPPGVETNSDAQRQFILLPQGYQALDASENGVVLLLKEGDTDTKEYYRWYFGELTHLLTSTRLNGEAGQYRSVDYEINRVGDIVLEESFSKSTDSSRVVDDRLLFYPFGSSTPQTHRPPLLQYSRYSEVTSGNVSHSVRSIREMEQLDNSGRLWAEVEFAVGSQSFWGGFDYGALHVVEASGFTRKYSPYIEAPGSSDVSYTLEDISESGLPVGEVRNLGSSFKTYFVGTQSVDYRPLKVNINGTTLGVATSVTTSHPDPDFVRFTNGHVDPVPSTGEHLFLDDFDRIHGYELPQSDQMVVWERELNAEGHPVVPLNYIQKDYVTLEVPAEWTTDLLVAPDDLRAHVGTASPVGGGDNRQFLSMLLKVDLVPDYGRDGAIDQSDRGQVTDSNPFRWWLNDDDDISEVEGKDRSGEGTADHSNAVVDTERDLVDFFPVFIDLKSLLDAVDDVSTLTVKLKHADGGLKFVYTDLLPEDSKNYWYESGLTTGYGSDFTDAPGEADTIAITSSGVELSEAFLNKMKDEDKGVILLEGAGSIVSTEPLVLEVSNSSGTLFEFEMPLSLSPVDEMFRHVNLAGHVGTSETHPDKTGEPSNNPDSLSNGKHFAFIHGYNVSQDAAQGWHSEIFKRMHQTGSKAKFIGVTWDGDTSPDYHNAVYRAFKTSAQVAGELDGFSDLTIAAHSLGNMVISNAIAKHSFLPENYYLLNAATPIEAYSGTQTSNSSGNADMNESMTENDWKDFPDRLFASNWYDLFESGDVRRELTWKDRFTVVKNFGYNFYSDGEDVVENASDNESVTLSLWNLFTNWVTGENIGTHAWVTQEIAKGGKNILVHAAFAELHGGWKFNGSQSDLEHVGILKSFPADTDSYRPRFASETSETVPTDEQLAQFGFFKRFNELDLYAPIDDANAIPGVTQTQTQASTVANGDDVQWHLLAEAIPAMSFAAAANSVNDMQGNIDMESQTNGWPSSRSNTNWRHSDFKNISLNYVRPMYENILSIGGLNNE